MYYSTAEIISMISANEIEKFYNSRQWRSLSKDVIEDGKNECLYCKQKGLYKKAVLTHHYNELKKRPDLAYSRTFVDADGKVKKNLIPLCNDCHERVHKRGAYADMPTNPNKFWQEEKW